LTVMLGKQQLNRINADSLLITAPAKINLTLLVAGKRSDGFHELETIMAKVAFYDELLVEKRQSPDIELSCQGLRWAPPGADNLVYKAAERILQKSRPKTGLKLTLTKNIPPGSGLGSASSDAAAALVGINNLLDLNLSAGELNGLAAGLGSDVSFFLNGPAAFCTGKGEKVNEIAEKINFIALVVLPDVSVSTKRVYENYHHDPDTYHRLRRRIMPFFGKNGIDLTQKICANMLESTCYGLHKELFQLKNKMEEVGLGPLQLSGSGSAMFRLFECREYEKAKKYQKAVQDEFGCQSILVRNNRW